MRIIVVLILALISAQAAWSSQEQEAQAILQRGMQEKNPDLRKEAVISVGLVGARSQAYDLLKDMLADSDVLVRVAVVGTLAELKDSRSIPLLKQALQDKVPEVSFAAAKALWALKDPAGKEVLLSVVQKETKAKSGMVTAHMRDTMRKLKTPKSAILFAFRQGAGLVPLPGFGEGMGALESLMSDAEFSARANAVLLLARDEDAATRDAIRDGLTDTDWSMRAAALQIIALRNQPEGLSDMALLLDDKKDKVRFRAAAGYLRLSSIAAERKKRAVAPKKAG